MINPAFGRTALVVSLALSSSALAADESPPAAPTFEGWTVKSDDVVTPAKTAQVGKKLGAKLTSLRNTIYDVSGEKVQVNVMTVATDGEADKLVASITKTKAPWSCVRNGTTVYELVGSNKAADAMKKASATLSGK